MQEIVDKLKSLKNVTQTQYNELIDKYAYEELLKELKEAGISKEDLSESEFNELLQNKTKEVKSFANGALAATGLFLFLEFLG